ncbi:MULTISPECIES: ImmA/IrrE family metallo-endopeptidase [unclassified Clostridium]|uniref:ImmA/IrrE family metallo-endopeptidase n=1 Tax=unclassified Clostridium TaxID=2614128 RepID=UPI003217ADAC
MDNNSLSSKQIYELSEMAKEKRRELDIGTAPMGDSILKFIREKGIKLIYVPIENSDTDELFFSAVYVCIKEDDCKTKFIGLNTNDYYDNQIFALGHELYHYYEESSVHLCRISNDMQSIRELKANRFAAEFLLPTDKLEKEIKGVNDGELQLYKWKQSTLLRLIARLHCEYRLPYKAIVKRLLEINAIKREQYTELFNEPTRNENDEYYTIGLSINSEIFKLLNSKTMKKGVDGSDLETVVRNYEDGIISLSDFIESLEMFDKKIHDFGVVEDVDIEDIAEMEEMFGVEE